ncbi:MAG: hypothetical protein BAJATHORv1_30423 [Candidatus Thorarchaeota archaeon]|nr:MAG: hypothetical protein BAJATHORv1_30423 [Candidatus Thorarchaeota archaeon]
MSEEESVTESESSGITWMEELRSRFSSEGFGLKKREISVMTRMSSDIVEILDALVELEIFRSRSEAVAAFVEKSISGRRQLFEEIRIQAEEIVLKREAAKKLAFEAMREDMKET